MVWQLVVLPGAQTVTETNGILISPGAAAGPASTVMAVTLEPVGGGIVVVPLLVSRLLPPQPTRPRITASGARASNRVMTTSLLNSSGGCVLRHETRNIGPPLKCAHPSACLQDEVRLHNRKMLMIGRVRSRRLAVLFEVIAKDLRQIRHGRPAPCHSKNLAGRR